MRKRLAVGVCVVTLSACGGRTQSDANTQVTSDDECSRPAGTVETIARAAFQPGPIATDSTSVYWFEIRPMGLTAFAKNTRDVTELAPGHLGQAMMTDDQYVYWIEAFGKLLRAPKMGGTAQVLAAKAPSDAAQVWIQLTLDESFVYWVNEGPQGGKPKSISDRSQVFRIAKSGGSIDVLASGQQDVSDVAVNADYVYWIARDGIWRWSNAAQTTERFLNVGIERPEVYGLALDDSYVYWSDDHDVFRSSTAHPNAERVLSEAAPVLAMFLNGSCLYAVAGDSLVRGAKSGGAPRVVADLRGNRPTFMTVDDSGVYWTVPPTSSSDPGRVMHVSP